MRLLRQAVVTLLVLTAPSVAPAQATAARWEFSVSPYFLVPHMNGTTGIRGFTTEIDVGPEEVFENLQFGIMAYVEARKAPWAVSFDVLYMDLGKDGEKLPTKFDAHQGAVELAAYRRVAPWAELLAGGRVNFMGGGVEVSGTSYDQDKTWFDPIVGVRLRAPTAGRWDLSLRGDIGGFGVGSKFAWQIYPLVEFRASRVVGITAAYRAFDMDYESDDGFIWDVTTFGPELGVTFHF